MADQHGRLVLFYGDPTSKPSSWCCVVYLDATNAGHRGGVGSIFITPVAGNAAVGEITVLMNVTRVYDDYGPSG
jgi:hypothetical protein